MKVNINVVQPVPLHIAFLLSGDNFPAGFVDSLLNLIIYCENKKIEFTIIRRYSSVVYFVRNLCLGGDVRRGVNQKPFDGKLNYTHMMWIDRDSSFKPEDFQTLLDLNLDIVSGIYKIIGGKYYAVVRDWDEEHFQKKGSFQFLTENDFKDYKGLMEVVYTGFGFILIKRGVFESLTYPWFKPIFYEIGNCFDFCAEDVGFCKRIIEKGYKIYVDPRVRIGHIKETIF